MQLLRAGLAALTVILISRWLGAEGRGELSIILFFVQILMIVNEYVGGSSLANMLVRHPAGQLLPFSHLWALAVVVVGSFVFSIFYTPEHTIFIAALALPLAFLSIAWNIFQGLAMVYQRNVLQMILEGVKLVLLVVAAWLAGVLGEQLVPLRVEISEFNTRSIIWIYSVASTFVLVFAWVLLKNRIKRGELKFLPPNELISSGFWSQNGHLVQFLNYRLSLILLASITGTNEAAGVYSNVLLIADTIWIFGNSFGTIAHMRLLQSKNQRFRADITLRYAVISTAGTAAAVLLSVLIPSTLFTAVFGADFIELRSTLLWISPAILALGASTLFSHYLHAVNRFRVLLLSNLAGLALQVVLALMLIPQMGLKGAALAADAGFLLILIIVFLLFRKENPDASLHGRFRLKALLKVLRG